MFKRLILIFLAGLLLSSCDCPYYWDEYDRRHDYGVHYKNDIFYAEKLIGTWQCCYPTIIGSVEFKQITFMPGGKADVTMCQVRGVEWYTETYSYTYYGKTLRLSKDGSVIMFTIVGYIFPELTLSDSFGNHIWRYVRAYGC